MIKDKFKNYIKKVNPYVLAFFIVYFLVGTFVVKHYGISWDENAQRVGIGEPAYNYVFHDDETYLSVKDRYYGPVFEIFLIGVERVFNIEDLRNVYLMRHFFNFLLFFVGTVFFYLLCTKRFKNWKYGLLGAAFLVLSPRFFAESFYNSKDLPFLSLFIVSTYTLFSFLEDKSWKKLTMHAITTGLLIDVRILGILMIGLTFLCTGLDLIKDKFRSWKDLLPKGLFYIFLTNVVIYAFMPILWRDPFTNFLNAFNEMKKFPWDGGVLYRGEVITATMLPWHYLPFWIIISTPILYLVLAFIGLIKSLNSFTLKPIKTLFSEDRDILFLAWLVLPIAMVILLDSVIYDSWRHVYFIYPAFIMLALIGTQYLIKNTRRWHGAKYIIGTVIGFSLFSILSYMVLHHPHQNVYFNSIYRSDVTNINGKIELDYWGLSYKQGLEYILYKDKSEKIKIFVENSPGFANHVILPKAQRERLEYVNDISQANYFLGNNRSRKTAYPYEQFYAINIEGVKIMYIYKIN